MSKRQRALSQVAALPYRMVDDRVEVLLVTSRKKQQWIIPKGWSEKGVKPHAMAAREAFEEAGVRGKIGKRPYGSYQYRKRLTDDSTVQCRVAVYLLQVEEELEEWPERAERERRWISWFQVPLYSRRIGLTMLLLRFGFTGKSAQSRQVSGTCAAGRSSAQVLRSIIGDIKR